MLLIVLFAIILTFVNIQNCPNLEKHSKQLKDGSFYMKNSTDLQDRNLKIASEKLDLLYFKRYQKKRCAFLCHDVHKKNVTNTRKIPNHSVMHLLYSAQMKNRKRFCTLLWKCQM